MALYCKGEVCVLVSERDHVAAVDQLLRRAADRHVPLLVPPKKHAKLG